jgi:alkylation response protein AidB-like acyl-CoA dehydrogenase
MRKAGDLGFLSVAVPEAYGGMGMGFVNTVLVCDYISGATGSFSTALEHIQELELCQSLIRYRRTKNKIRA